jgi:hypothetical protein
MSDDFTLSTHTDAEVLAALQAECEVMRQTVEAIDSAGRAMEALDAERAQPFLQVPAGFFASAVAATSVCYGSLRSLPGWRHAVRRGCAGS